MVPFGLWESIALRRKVNKVYLCLVVPQLVVDILAAFEEIRKVIGEIPILAAEQVLSMYSIKISTHISASSY